MILSVEVMKYVLSSNKQGIIPTYGSVYERFKNYPRERLYSVVNGLLRNKQLVYVNKGLELPGLFKRDYEGFGVPITPEVIHIHKIKGVDEK